MSKSDSAFYYFYLLMSTRCSVLINAWRILFQYYKALKQNSGGRMTDDWYFTQRLIQIFLLQAHLSSVIHSPRHFFIMLSAFIYLVFFMLLKILSNALHHHHHQFSDNNDHYHFFFVCEYQSRIELGSTNGKKEDMCVQGNHWNVAHGH